MKIKVIFFFARFNKLMQHKIRKQVSTLDKNYDMIVFAKKLWFNLNNKLQPFLLI